MEGRFINGWERWESASRFLVGRSGPAAGDETRDGCGVECVKERGHGRDPRQLAHTPRRQHTAGRTIGCCKGGMLHHKLPGRATVRVVVGTCSAGRTVRPMVQRVARCKVQHIIEAVLPREGVWEAIACGGWSAESLGRVHAVPAALVDDAPATSDSGNNSLALRQKGR